MREWKGRPDPPRDPELGWWLARSGAAPTLSGRERDRLRTRILHRAAPVLEARQLPVPWWNVAAAWARPALPMAAAAALVLVALAFPGRGTELPGALALPELEALLLDALPAEEIPWFTEDPAEIGVLLQAAVEYR